MAGKATVYYTVATLAERSNRLMSPTALEIQDKGREGPVLHFSCVYLNRRTCALI